MPDACKSSGLKTVFLSLYVAFTFFTDPARAATPPEELVTAMTEQLLAKTALEPAPLDAAALHDLVETVIMPNVDLRGMTARAVGPRWRSAENLQKTQLMSAFEALLIKTYVGALSQAAGAKFRLKTSIPVDAVSREIRSEVARAGAAPVALSYRMSLQAGDWKVTDVGVMDVWLVPTYHSQFAQVLQNSGVDGLIRVIAAQAQAR